MTIQAAQMTTPTIPGAAARPAPPAVKEKGAESADTVSLGTSREWSPKSMKESWGGEGHSFISRLGGAIFGGLVGASIGSAALGPVGGVVGLVLGAAYGNDEGFAGTVFPVLGAKAGSFVGAAVGCAVLGPVGLPIGAITGAIGGFLFGKELAH